MLFKGYIRIMLNILKLRLDIFRRNFRRSMRSRLRRLLRLQSRLRLENVRELHLLGGDVGHVDGHRPVRVHDLSHLQRRLPHSLRLRHVHLGRAGSGNFRCWRCDHRHWRRDRRLLHRLLRYRESRQHRIARDLRPKQRATQ